MSAIVATMRVGAQRLAFMHADMYGHWFPNVGRVKRRESVKVYGVFGVCGSPVIRAGAHHRTSETGFGTFKL